MQPQSEQSLANREGQFVSGIPAPVETRFQGAVSWHAWQRMSARGVSPEAVETVLNFGRALHGWPNAVCFFIGWREVEKARREGVDLTRLEGLHVLTAADSGVIITTWRNRSPRIRRR